MFLQANDTEFKKELAKVVGTEVWDEAKAAASSERKVSTTKMCPSSQDSKSSTFARALLIRLPTTLIDKVSVRMSQ